jgi:MFS transporter, ACS family, tartrate transporter
MTNAVGSLSTSISTRTIRKLRARLLPFIFILYVLAYLDRINIGFAALTMNRELGITSQQFGLVAGIFFFGYFLFEIPSNLLLHKIGARIWIARILLTWGAIAVLTGFAQSVQQLYIARFLLGLAEAGYFPGMILYLTYWFPQREQARTIAMFLTGNPITSILGAPISGLILDHAHWFNISSWRWLLILEGIPAIIFGFLTYILLPSRPDEAKFLATEEKEWLRKELAREEEQKLQQHKFSVSQALANGRVWCLVGIYLGMMIGSYTLTLWAPQLVKSLSSRYSNSLVGFLVMIPSLVGLLGMILISRSSDRRLERRYHVAIPAVAGALALVLLGSTQQPVFAVAFLAALAVSVYGFLGPFWALPSQFLTGFSAAAGIALINSIGNLGGFIGPSIIGATKNWTGNVRVGLSVIAICMLVSAALVLLLPPEARAHELTGEKKMDTVNIR